MVKISDLGNKWVLLKSKSRYSKVGKVVDDIGGMFLEC